MLKKFIGKSRAENLDWLVNVWLKDGPPVCFLQGFSGVGKTDLARDVRELAEKQQSPDKKHKWQQAVIRSGGTEYAIPRYVFLGPDSGGDPIRVALFAGIHGDEPEGVRALIRLLYLLAQRPELASGYCLFIYPILNPTGLEDGTRGSRTGKDLNREFWRGTDEPEVRHVEQELLANDFQGIISLHTDDTSLGFYGFAHGRTLTEQLLEPALKAAEQHLPRNRNDIIDGFNAVNGIIKDRFEGILSAPPDASPRPFEIILETPQAAPDQVKEAALVLSVQSILEEYRRFIAYAPNL